MLSQPFIGKADRSVLRTPAAGGSIRIPGFRPTYSCSLARQMSAGTCMQAYGSRRRLPGLSQQKSPSLRDCLHTGTSFTRGTTPIPAVSAGIFGRVTCGITAQPTFHVQPCGSGAKLNLLPEPWMLPADDIHSLLENRDLKHLLRLFLLFFRYVHLNHPFLKSQALLLLFFFAFFPRRFPAYFLPGAGQEKRAARRAEKAAPAHAGKEKQH